MRFINEPYFPIISEPIRFILWLYEKIRKPKSRPASNELIEFLEKKGFHFPDKKERDES